MSGSCISSWPTRWPTPRWRSGDAAAARDRFLEIAAEDPAQEPEYLYAQCARHLAGDTDLSATRSPVGPLGSHARWSLRDERRLPAASPRSKGRPAEALTQYEAALRGSAARAGLGRGPDRSRMAQLLDPADPSVPPRIESSRADIHTSRREALPGAPRRRLGSAASCRPEDFIASECPRGRSRATDGDLSQLRPHQ